MTSDRLPSARAVPGTHQALRDLVRRTATALEPQALPADAGAALTATADQVRSQELAQLRATEVLRRALDEHAQVLALGLLRREDAPATHTDIGDAVGVSADEARSRFPGATTQEN